MYISNVIKKAMKEIGFQRLEAKGVKIDPMFTQRIIEDIRILNDVYTLRGHAVIEDMLSVSYGDYKPGKYFPSVEPDNTLHIEDLVINLDKVDNITFYFSSAYWMDIHFHLKDKKGLVTLCLSPSIYKEKIEEKLRLNDMQKV